ncbi:hypothetical protein GCM10009836_07480 [Pseudonocardia ailaonensis]|uniref:Uncharacterized protein n=1 Tax=Pseudonocardia ailaonensis TaxID=367279 RepID=A0ABN2MMN0_9PSEU
MITQVGAPARGVAARRVGGRHARAGRAEAPPGAPGGASRVVRAYRYWPVFDAVSIARPVASFLPVTSVRM